MFRRASGTTNKPILQTAFKELLLIYYFSLREDPLWEPKNNTMRAIPGIIILVLIVLCMYFYESKHEIKDQINNEVFISGRIIKISMSRNHGFSICTIVVDSSNIDKFIIISYKDQCPAFQIRKDTAEIYGAYFYQDSVGDYLIMDGPANLIISKNKSGKIISKCGPPIQSVTEGDDRCFIRRNTIFKDVSKQND